MLIRAFTLLLLVSAGTATTTLAETTPAAVGAPREIRVGMATVYPPFAFKEHGELTGVEVDFANHLAIGLGVPVKLIEVPWDDLIPALRDRRIDIIMSGMSPTEERAKLVSFTEPYLQVGQMALIRAEDFDRLRDPSAMNAPGIRVGFHRNTTGEFYARRALTQATLKSFDSIDAGIAALRAKEIDFFIHEAPTVWRIRGQLKSQYEDLMGRYRPLTQEFLAWAVRKDAEGDALRVRLNAQLDHWEDSGWIESVLDRWIPVRKVAVDVKTLP